MESSPFYPDRTATVTYENFQLAHTHWCDFHYQEPSEFPLFNNSEYDKFMGMPMRTAEWADRERTTVAVTPAAAAKINMLAGPHFYTLLRAYQVKQAGAENV